MKMNLTLIVTLATLSFATACGSVDNTNNHSSVKADSDQIIFTPDNCLGDQDMAAEDVDISNCPAVPMTPQDTPLGLDGETRVDLGAWELGTTGSGESYKYGTLSEANTTPRVLSYDGGSDEVNEGNLTCWAKGYYRLRKILQNSPAEYLALRNAGFQGRFFQFQTDLRNGSTGFKEIASYRDHLVKWVTVISEDGTCIQPTFDKFVAYAASELERREL